MCRSGGEQSSSAGPPLQSAADQLRMSSLLRQPSTDQPTSCPNLDRWPKDNSIGFPYGYNHPAAPLAAGSFRVSIIFFITNFAESYDLESCKFVGCERFRESCRQAIPPCQWMELREFIIIYVSCWMYARQLRPELKLIRNPAKGFLIDNFNTHKIVMKNVSEVDIRLALDVLKLFDWIDMWNVAAFPENPSGTVKTIPSDVLESFLRREWAISLFKATEACPSICPTSLWNIADSDNGNYAGALAIIDHLSTSSPQGPFPGTQRTHANCNAQLCTHAFENTTQIRQLHKCKQKNCKTVDIPIQKLEDRFQNPRPWQPSAWDISQWDSNMSGSQSGVINNLIDNLNKAYMAVSHVWSDGTGVGQKRQGTVNSCLLDFWVSIAKKNSCDGLWWDTICLPIQPGPRRNALNVMLQTFQRAAVLLIHDQDLASSTWVHAAKPQNVAIGLVLSNWFTRGWTAAEFSAASNKIAVVLPNPDPQDPEPFTMGLEDIIFTPDTCSKSLPTLAHLQASRILTLNTLQYVERSICDLSEVTFDSLLRVLRPRSTAWEKDRMVIATLMWNNYMKGTLDSSLTMPQLTQGLLRSMKIIPRSAIFHGEVPISSYGGWSWCSQSIFDLGKYGYRELHDDTDWLGRMYIGERGVARAHFYVRTVTPDDKDSLCPLGSQHPMIYAKIQNALKDHENCLILRAADDHIKVAPSLLVMPVGHKEYKTPSASLDEPWKQDIIYHYYISCKYIGSVYSIGTEKQPLVGCLLGDDEGQNGKPKSTIDAIYALEKASYF
ncbi:hypothetical protein K449DRAFT_419579 [Hypoxylon sp. EC38]|nr:hypothetical protein K449DRAFT_419579 [Hypoxylon sp. EC38]